MRIVNQIIKNSIIFTLLACLLMQTILAEDEILMDLVIDCPLQVNENFYFSILITSNNVFIDNVTVTFNDQTNITNSEGIVGFIAPRVLPDENKTYTIIASKEGYNTTTCQITVLDYPQVFPIVSISNILEKTMFIVTIIDDERRVVNDAKVIFNGREYLSSGTGTVTLTAPAVNKSQMFNISVSKQGYIDSTISVTIYPSISSENIIGFYFVIGICIFIIILTGIYMVFKNIRRKKINRK